MDKHEFLSSEWVRELQVQLEDGLAGEDLTGIDYTLCEEYTNAPTHLRADGSTTVGFHFRLRDGHIEVGDWIVDGADFRLVADYATMEPLVRLTHAETATVTGMDPREHMAKGVADGTLQFFGRVADMPPVIAKVGLHDRLAVRTR